MTHPPRHLAMPEWLNRNDCPPRPWKVLSGPLLRGEAFTDLAGCRMRIPVGTDETSRCVRAHELMHAKVSPMQLWRPDSFDYLSNDVLITAEEFRVNQLTRAAGFPVDRALSDGSETRSGERIGSSGDWNAAVSMVAATSGTKAGRGVFTGVRRTRPEWIADLRHFDKQLKKAWKRATVSGTQTVASTQPWGEATLGWRFTLEIAQIIHFALRHETAHGPPFTSMTDSNANGTRGSFARPVILEAPLVRRSSGRMRATRVSASTGRRPRHIERLLTDPHRRVFEQRIRTAGGVVLIDQSGSMRLTDEQVWDMIRAAPGCTVIGYSHEARSTGFANIWVLARDGRMVDRVPRGNGGNGVDGPALRFAASLRTRHDPYIWVCDGYVTDSFDDHSDELTRECAALVTRYRIHQVPDVPAAIRSLSRAARGERLAVQAIGPVKNHLSSR